MLVWLIFAGMTGAAVMALLWPLGRRGEPRFADAADAASLYRAQLAEIARDRGRGLIGETEAEAARAEAGRRLLRAADTETEATGETEGSLRRRRAASAFALSIVPLLALFLYGAYGSPDLPDRPLSARLGSDPAKMDFAVALARLETHLAANPADAKGWKVIAPIYLRQGRYDDAVRAYGAVLAGGSDLEAVAGLAEARMLAAGGVVTAEAREGFAEVLRRVPDDRRARFFLAVAREQDGDAAGATAEFRKLLAEAPGDAPWRELVEARLAALDGSKAGGAIAALPPGERNAAIEGMVDSLAERLKEGGGSREEWLRLIRSQAVLGRREAALAALATARERLAGDTAALTEIAALAGELGLEGETR